MLVEVKGTEIVMLFALEILTFSLASGKGYYEQLNCSTPSMDVISKHSPN
jgi:hypothetical protein